MKNLLILIALALTSFTTKANTFYNVTDYGAKGDGIQLNTKFIQKTIDECAVKGGGTVYFPAGKFITGTIFLKSNITLYIDAGAELLGSTNLADYPSVIPALHSYVDLYTEHSLIYAEKLDHISIIGQGTINGMGDHFPVRTQPLKVRPYLMRMIECTNIRLRDITLKNPAMWTQHYLACEDLYIDNIHVDSWQYNVNNDGIDIDGCNRVMITNSYIKAEDDGIVFKSSLARSCKNITVSNCIVTSLCNAFKCGTESVGGFENIVVSNCVVLNTRYSGIALESIDGAVMKNISFNNIAMDYVSNPIFIRLGARLRPYLKGVPKPEVGSIENVTISNIHATNIGGFTNEMLSPNYLRSKAYAKPDPIGSSILGLPDHPIKNVVIKDVTIDYKGGGKKLNDTIPETETLAYPDYYRFGNFPSYAFYSRHVDGLRFENVKVTYRAPDQRPAVWLNDANNVIIDHLDAQYEKETDALIVFSRSKNLVVDNNFYFNPMPPVISLINGSTGVTLQNNLFPKGSKTYLQDGTIIRGSITQR